MQDIPWEAGETLAFTPEALAGLDDPPVFTLRTPTPREKRFRQKLLRRKMVERHGEAEIRAETMRALEALWGKEQFDRFRGTITAYWERLDDFQLLAKDDPDLVWDFDPDEEREILRLLKRAAKAWPPLGEMNDENGEYEDTVVAATLAVTVRGWTGLDTVPDIAEGYLTTECVEEIGEALAKLGAGQGVARGLPYLQLFLACDGRFRLDEEEEKNSASPSPSSESPPPSSGTDTPETSGKSPASARSTKTREAR